MSNLNLEHISWVQYNAEGLQIGENSAHWANWDTGRTLCGIDLRPTTGMRAGWDRHNYDGGRDASTCCKRCEASKDKIDTQEANEEQEYRKAKKQKAVDLQNKNCTRWLENPQLRGQEAIWTEEIQESDRNTYYIYYEGDITCTEVDQDTYELFRSTLEKIKVFSF